MLRWLAVAALGAAFLTVPVWGQRRGGGSMGFSGHGGFASHGSSFGGHGAGMMSRGFGASSFRGGAGGGYSHGWRGPIAGNRSFYGNRSYRRFGRGYYGGYPWYGYGNPWWYDDGYGDTQPAYPPDDYSSDYDPGDAAMQAQQAEIDRLHSQLDNSRGRSPQQASPSSQSKDDSLPTELVFRDKHTEEVQNYAIVGSTLYDLTDGHRRKIPLADLDLTATAKQNDDRGVDFQVPRGSEAN